MTDSQLKDIYNIKSQALQQIIIQCNECKLSNITDYIDISANQVKQLRYLLFTKCAFKVSSNQQIDPVKIKIGNVSFAPSSKVKQVTPEYMFLRITCVPDQGVQDLFIVPILLNYQLNWFQLFNLDQYISYHISQDDVFPPPLTLDIDLSRPNSDNKSILGLILNTYARYGQSSMALFFHQMANLHIPISVQLDYNAGFQAKKPFSYSQNILENRAFDFNTLNNLSHNLYETQHSISSCQNKNLLGAEQDQINHLQRYFGGLECKITNMARMTLTEFQGFLFNIMLILKFDTSVPLSYYKIKFSDDLTKVSLILDQNKPEITKPIPIKEWIIQVVKDYLQTDVDSMIIYDLMMVPDNYYNRVNKINQMISYNLQIK